MVKTHGEKSPQSGAPRSPGSLQSIGNFQPWNEPSILFWRNAEFVVPVEVLVLSASNHACYLTAKHGMRKL